MAIGQATADIANIELEKVQDFFPELLKDEQTLYGVINDNGRSARVGTGSTAGAYRIVLKTARPGNYKRGDLDGPALPTGKGSTYDKLYVTPQVLMLPIGFTKEAQMVGVKEQGIGVRDVVKEAAADAADQLKIIMNQLLISGDGAGKLATMVSADTSGHVATVASTPYGARLISPGQKVSFWSTTTLYGTAVVSKVFNQLGIAQTFSYSGFVGANSKAEADINAAGIIVRCDGLTDGAPVFIHGLPYVHSTSTAGTYFNLTRSVSPYVIAPGYDAGAAQISLPVLRLLINMIESRLGSKGLKGLSSHTHPSQIAAYEELGFERQTLPLADGKAKGLDLLYSGVMKVADYPVLRNTDADQTVWDFIQPKAWGKVQLADGPFWYEAGAMGRVYPLYDTSGAPLTEFGSTLVSASDFYNDNPLAGGRISNLKVPAGN